MPQRGMTTARRLAHVLDDAIPIPGTNRRIGIDPLLGLVPGGGDIAGAALAAYTMVAAARVGAPSSVLLRMAGNILLDTVLGAVPLVGDLFDAAWKANRRNVELLERYIEEPRPVQTRTRLLLAALLLGLLIAVAGVVVLTVRILAWIF